MSNIPPLRIFVVGDVHEHWDSGSESAVRAQAPDIVLFVGDYGDESEECVARIAKFCGSYDDVANGRMACAVLGNHEALKHAFDPTLDSGAPLRQRELLSAFNPMECPRMLPNSGPAVLGGRPFSFGGAVLGRFAHVPERFAGIKSMQESEQRMCRDVDSVIQNNNNNTPIIFLSHNGPTGLGSEPNDICGNDYEKDPATGDEGDPDLRAAIEYARARGMRVPLVTFGHFHRNLQPWQAEKNGLTIRKMVAVDKNSNTNNNNTVYVNAAFVPRIKTDNEVRLHHFMSVQLDRDGVQKVDAIWCTESGEICIKTCYYDSELGGLTGAA